jgi:DNA-binding IclR family transcriptional regulator
MALNPPAARRSSVAKQAALVCEEILTLLSETPGMTFAEIARETRVSEEDARKVLKPLIAVGLVKVKHDGLTIDSGLREIVLSTR